MVDVVTRMLIALVETTDGITQTMTEMDTSITKANTSKGSSQQHLALSFMILRILDSARKVFNNHLQGVKWPDITDGVGTLVSRSLDGILGTRRTLVVRQGGVWFKSMTDGNVVSLFAFSPNVLDLPMTYHKTSKPLEAWTWEGMLRVFKGSTIPRRGLRARWAIPVLVLRGS